MSLLREGYKLQSNFQQNGNFVGSAFALIVIFKNFPNPRFKKNLNGLTDCQHFKHHWTWENKQSTKILQFVYWFWNAYSTVIDKKKNKNKTKQDKTKQKRKEKIEKNMTANNFHLEEKELDALKQKKQVKNILKEIQEYKDDLKMKGFVVDK